MRSTRRQLDARARLHRRPRALPGRSTRRSARSSQSSQHDFLEYYDSHPDDAEQAAAVGEAPAAREASPAELAALTMVANQMFNLDEVLNK